MKKIIVTFAIALLAGTGSINAQACSDGAKLSSRVASVLKNYQPVIENIPYVKQIAQIKKHWQTIAGNSSAKMGPRQMPLDNSKVTGVVVGPTQRTFISPPSKHSKLEIKLDKVSGKAKTDLFICVHPVKGSSKQLKEYRFENGKGNKTKKFTINDVKGKMISVVIKGKSVGNTFGYQLRVKKVE